jgi:hypothetical protein
MHREYQAGPHRPRPRRWSEAGGSSRGACDRASSRRFRPLRT